MISNLVRIVLWVLLVISVLVILVFGILHYIYREATEDKKFAYFCRKWGGLISAGGGVVACFGLLWALFLVKTGTPKPEVELQST